MKRILALILALVMTMALVACGGDKATTSTPSTSTPSTSTTTPSTPSNPSTGHVHTAARSREQRWVQV